jgi:hypothetical protein
MKYNEWLKETETVFSGKNKAVSQTAIRLLEKIFRAESFPTDSNVNSGRKAETALTSLLDDVRNATPVVRMSTTQDGERYLTADTIQNRASGYVLKTRDIARLKRDTERRLAELDSMLKNIEAKIPHAQSADFHNEVMRIAKEFESVPL